MGRLLEYTALLLATASIVLTPWLKGGRVDFIYDFFGVIALFSGVLIVLRLFRDVLYKASVPWVSIISLLPWLGFFIYWCISLYNPIYILNDNATSLVKNPDYIENLPISTWAERSQDMGIGLLGCLLLGIAFSYCVRTRRSIRFLLISVVINASVLSLIGICGKLLDWDRILSSFSSNNTLFFATYQYPNHWIAYSLIGFSCCAALLMRVHAMVNSHENQRNFIFGYWSLLVVVLLSVFFTLSRSGLILYPLFVTLAFTAYCIFNRRFRIQFKSIFFIIPVVALFLGAIFYLSFDEWSDRIETSKEQIERVKEGKAPDQRLQLMSMAISMFQDRPFLGWGYGSYALLFDNYAKQLFVGTDLKVFARSEFAHNDWAQYLAEFGILGFVMLMATPIIFLIRSIVVGKYQILPIYLLLGCLVILLFSLWDFPLSNFSIVCSFTLCFSSALSYARLSK